MNNLLKYSWVSPALLVLFLFSGGALAQPTTPTPPPASTGGGSVGPSEAAVYLDLVNQGRREEDRVKTGKVIFRRTTWKGAVLAGYVTDTQSVLLGSLIIDNQVYPVQAASKLLLGKEGWEQANFEVRKGLAIRFVKEILLGFEEQLLDQAPVDFPKNGKTVIFRAPKIGATSTGGVQIEGWIQEAPKSSGGVTYRRSTFWFSPAGQLVRVHLSDRLVTP